MSMMPNKDGLGGLPIFTGVVEDLADPLELGRIKVRVVNQTDNGDPPPTEDLQWFSVMGPTTSSGDGSGSSPTWIQVGAKVIGIYLDGATRRMPLIIGTLWTIPGMDINNHGVHKLARGENPLVKEPVGPEPESPFAAKYPFNKVIGTPGGNIIELDDTPDAERVHIYHKSGSYFEIGPDGTVVRKSVKDDVHVVVGNSEVYVEGSVNVLIKGDSTIKVEGNHTLDVGGDINMTAGGNIKLTGSRIDLN